MKPAIYTTILAACLAFAGCKKECGYITVESSKTRKVYYNDSLFEITGGKQYTLDFKDSKFYYQPDPSYWDLSDPVDTMSVKDCQSIKL